MNKILLSLFLVIALMGTAWANNGWYSTLQGTASDVEQTTPPNGVTIAYNTTDHQWEFNYGLAPAGGTTGTCLEKNSNSDYDYSWVSCSGGSQTPWTSNINGGGYQLSNFTMVNAVSNALSTYTFNITGTPITGGTSTTTFPLIFIGNTATPVATWNTAGTILGMSPATGFTGDFVDFHGANGGSSEFSVQQNGTVTAGNSLNAPALTSSNSANNFYSPSQAAITNSTVSGLQYAGSTGDGIRIGMNGATSTTLTTNYNYSSFIIGSQAVTTPATGTNAWLSNMVINPIGTVTSGGATITNTASLYVGSSIASGTNNYSIYSAGGLDYFGGSLDIGTPGYTDSGILLQLTSSTNSYNQMIIQNTNSGSSASSNYIVSNNLGTASTYYGEFGMNSSTYSGTDSFSKPNAVYLDSQSGDLSIGTLMSNPIHFEINSAIVDAMTIGGSTDTVLVNSSLGGLTINASSIGVGGIDSNTVLMLPLNNSVADLSQNAFTVTNNNVTFSNSSPYFSGTYYGVFNGTNADIVVPNSSLFNFSGNFTIDLAINFSSNPGSSGASIIGNGGTSGFDLYFFSNQLDFIIANVDHTVSFTPTLNTWYHFAIVRNSNTINIYENGTSIYSFSYSSNITSSNSLYVGRDAVDTHYFPGNISEVRISNNARWTSNFTPPTGPYTNAYGIPTLTLANALTTLSSISTTSAYQMVFKNNGISALSITSTGNIQGVNNGNINNSTFTCGANGYAGTPVTTGTTNSKTMVTGGKIISSTITGGLSAGNCNCTVDIWKANAALPTVSNTITASALPALSSSTYSQNTTLSGWTTSISANDVIMCNIQSGCTCDNVNVVLGIAA